MGLLASTASCCGVFACVWWVSGMSRVSAKDGGGQKSAAEHLGPLFQLLGAGSEAVERWRQAVALTSPLTPLPRNQGHSLGQRWSLHPASSPAQSCLPLPHHPVYVSLLLQAQRLKWHFIYPFLVFMCPALVHCFQHCLQGKIILHEALAWVCLVVPGEFLFLDKCRVEPGGLGRDGCGSVGMSSPRSAARPAPSFLLLAAARPWGLAAIAKRQTSLPRNEPGCVGTFFNSAGLPVPMGFCLGSPRVPRLCTARSLSRTIPTLFFCNCQ